MEIESLKDDAFAKPVTSIVMFSETAATRAKGKAGRAAKAEAGEATESNRSYRAVPGSIRRSDRVRELPFIFSAHALSKMEPNLGCV